jgi:hypothetical protein
MADVTSLPASTEQQEDGKMARRLDTSDTAATTISATSLTSSAKSSTADADLIRQAEEYYAAHCHFQAAYCLKQVSDESLLQPDHRRMMKLADKAEATLLELVQPMNNETGWKKQGETHGHRDTMIQYKIHDDNSLVCRVETPIEESLLVPLISVFNESELYHTWMPQWRVPRLAMTESNKLAEFTRGHQIVQVLIEMPFPFDNRECIQHAYAIDMIDPDEESAAASLVDDNAIFVKVESLETGMHYDYDVEIPETRDGVTRVDFQAGILIRTCPVDHPLLNKSKADYPPGEKRLLLSLIQQIDAHVAGVPVRMVNFFTRTVLGRQWASLLAVAEAVRDGKRPEHQKAITAKQELYEWLEKRVQVMLNNLE